LVVDEKCKVNVKMVWHNDVMTVRKSNWKVIPQRLIAALEERGTWKGFE
jgi:hypothetical protein